MRERNVVCICISKIRDNIFFFFLGNGVNMLMCFLFVFYFCKIGIYSKRCFL